MTINIQNDISFSPFHILSSIVSIWSPFFPRYSIGDCGQYGDDFKCHHFQVWIKTFLYISMVHFLFSCKFFKVLRPLGFIKNALGPMHPPVLKKELHLGGETLQIEVQCFVKHSSGVLDTYLQVFFQLCLKFCHIFCMRKSLMNSLFIFQVPISTKWN